MEGDQLTLECAVTGIPSPTISWYKEDQLIDNDPNYILTKINSTCTLKVRNVKKEHASRYVCKAVNAGGEAASSARINMLRKNDI